MLFNVTSFHRLSSRINRHTPVQCRRSCASELGLIPHGILVRYSLRALGWLLELGFERICHGKGFQILSKSPMRRLIDVIILSALFATQRLNQTYSGIGIVGAGSSMTFWYINLHLTLIDS